MVLLSIVFAGCGAPQQSEPLIVGGTVVQEPYPFVVGLLEKKGGRPFCGGTLITPDVVVTAAHCVADGVSQLYVRISRDGLADRSAESTVDVPASRVVVNEFFSRKDFKNDVAIVALDRPWEGYIENIQLAGTDFPALVGDALEIVGVGNLTSIGTFRDTETLRKAAIKVLEPAQCRTVYSDAFGPENQICAGIPEGGVDSCRGDSGGPLLRRSEDGSYTLEGIVSFGKGCAQKNQPGVYTRVSSYKNWIEANIANLRAPFRDTLPETIRSMYLQTCFSPITELAERRLTGAAVYEYRRLRPDVTGFRELKTPFRDPLFEEILKGQISPSPGCRARFTSGTELKFYTAQTPKGIEQGEYWILGRVGDEPGFSFATAADYDFSLDVSCNTPGAFGGFFWSFDEKFGTASLSTPEDGYVSNFEKFEGDLPRQVRKVTGCEADRLKLELVALPRTPDDSRERFVLSVWNARSRDSGLDHRMYYSLQKDESRKPFELLAKRKTPEQPWTLQVKNVSEETLFGWELACEAGFELRSSSGRVLSTSPADDETRISVVESDDEFWSLESGQLFEFELTHFSDEEAAERVFCRLNGVGLILNFQESVN